MLLFQTDPQALRPQAQGAGGDGLRSGKESPAGESDLSTASRSPSPFRGGSIRRPRQGGGLRGFLHQLRRQGAQIFLILPQQLRGGQSRPGKLRVQLPEHRQHPVAQQVPVPLLQSVGGILHMGQAVLRQIPQDLLPGNGEQRPDDPVPHRGNAAEPPQSRAPAQVQQKGLGVVLRLVGGGDAAAAQASGGLPQERIAQLPGGFLQPHALCRGIGGNVSPALVQRDGEIPAEGGGEIPVPVRLRATDAVVIVGRLQAEAQLPGETQEQMQETNGVRAPAQGAQEGIRILQHPLGFHPGADSFQDIRISPHGAPYPGTYMWYIRGSTGR